MTPDESSREEGNTPDDTGHVDAIEKPCRWCRSKINANATVCNVCSKHQNRLLNYAAYLNLVPAVVSLVLILLSWQQLQLSTNQLTEAKAARVAKEQALASANEALDRVNTDAKRISEIKADLDFKYKQARSGIDEINRIVKASEANQKKLDELVDLHTLIVEADNDNREALLSLRAKGNDNSYRFSSLARRAFQENINRRADIVWFPRSDVAWKPGVDPSRLTLDQVVNNYWKIPDSFVKTQTIGYIWSRKDWPRYGKMEFLVAVIERDKSIRAAEHAGQYFNEATGLKIDAVIGKEHILEWWQKNKEQIRGH